MSKNRSFILSPVFVFVISLVSFTIAIALYVRTSLYAEYNLGFLIQNLRKVELDRSLISDPNSLWAVIVMSVCLTLIFVGMILIFIYYNKIASLYALQENFIANFTHELKTPMASIRLYLETLKKYEVRREDQLKFIDFMLLDTERLSKNVEQILTSSKLEANKSISATLENITLGTFIKSYLTDVRHIFNNVSMEVIEECKKCVVRVNPSHLEMILINVLQNAKNYNHQNDIKIQILLKCDSKKRMCVIVIKDNGIGIKGHETKKIFRKFAKGSNSAETYPKGTGLGLYLVKQLVKNYKGSITADSEGVNKGSTFTIMLPGEF